jgi:hypothetical protein
MQKRWRRNIDVPRLSLGIAVLAIAISLKVGGMTDLAYIVGLGAAFVGGLSVKREARVETESEWRHELLAFSDGLASFVPYLEHAFQTFVGGDHCKTKTAREVSNDWETMFKRAEWPDGQDWPLLDWERRFYENSNPYTKTVHDFAVALFTTTDLPHRGELDNWRRRTARTFDVWGDRLLHKVPGFVKFIDRFQVAEEYRVFVQILAYLEIGKVRETKSDRPPVLQGVWWLGKTYGADCWPEGWLTVRRAEACGASA